MSDLSELYQEVILDHNRNPRNFRTMDDANYFAEGFNPLCGDRVKVYLKVVDNVIVDVTFTGQGCAISTASASLMTDTLKGMDVEKARILFDSFHRVVTGKVGASLKSQGSAKLAVFSGVSNYPIRVKCATLPWHTLLAALADSPDPVSTE